MNARQLATFLKLLFIKNGYWKLLSLVIAVVVHFAIRSEISYTKEISVPVEVDLASVSGGAEVESFEPLSVRVTLRGSSRDLYGIDSSQVRCVLRPKQKKGALENSVVIKLRGSNLRGIRGVRISKIAPNSASVKFDDQKSELRLTVGAPQLLGKARGRVELEYMTNVIVKGSQNMLKLLDSDTARVLTDPVDVEGRSQSFNALVKLYPPGDAPNARVEPAEMEVKVKITSDKVSHTLKRNQVIIVQPLESANRWIADPPEVDILISGRAGEVEGIGYGQIVATVNGNISITPGVLTNEVPVLLRVQKGLNVDEVKSIPESVNLIQAALPAPLQTQGNDG